MKKKPTPQPKPVNPNVAAHGIPGFHNKTEPGDGKALAGMELDADIDPARVDTVTGDQPGNTDPSSGPPKRTRRNEPAAVPHFRALIGEAYHLVEETGIPLLQPAPLHCRMR